MNKNISVPQVTSDNSDDSYATRVDYAEAIRVGAAALGAAKVGANYYYEADETNEVYRLTPTEVASYGAGKLDDRGVDYSLWCACTGAIVKHPRAAVREALGIENESE